MTAEGADRAYLKHGLPSRRIAPRSRALAAGQAGVHRGPEAAMLRCDHRRAGMGFVEQDGDGEDDQCRGKKKETAHHDEWRLVDIMVEL